MVSQSVTTKTFSPRPRDIERRWYVIDAEGAVLGRLASEVAKLLRGKHKPIFAPHADTGDHVIVVNARGVRVTGGKETEKIYYRHSGYPGGIRGVGYDELLTKRPVLAVEKAVRGMLPKNRLGRQIVSKLAVYEGPDHPHQAQRPQPLGLGQIPRWEGLPAPKPPAPSKPAAKPRSAAKPKSRTEREPKGPVKPHPATAKRSTAARTTRSTRKPGAGKAKPDQPGARAVSAKTPEKPTAKVGRSRKKSEES
jgi:large subunit ribosomal protein L13